MSSWVEALWDVQFFGKINFLAFGFLAYSVALLQLPVQKCIVLVNTNTAWIVIVTIFVYGQFPNLKTLILVIISFFGIVLIVDPTMLKLGEIGLDDAELFVEKWPYYFLLIGAGMMGGMITLYLKAFGKK